MDRPRRKDQLAVNKIGKKIKKTPLDLPSLPNGNISKNGFRSIVPQPACSSKPQQNAPAALTQLNRPHVPRAMAQPPMHPHADQFCSNITAESHVSVCRPSLQTSVGDSGPSGNQMQPSHQYHSHSPLLNGSSPDKPICPSQLMYNKSLPTPRFNGDGLLPSPVSVRIPSPQSSSGDSGPNRNQMQPSHEHHHPSRFNGSASSLPILPSPRFNGRGILPTPPGIQYPLPLKRRSFTSSSMAQGGILGPGKFPQPPHASSVLVFPSPPFGENTN